MTAGHHRTPALGTRPAPAQGQHGKSSTIAHRPEVATLAATIPAALRAVEQWVLWHYTTGDKPRKILLDPHTGAAGKSTDPATWSSFDHVCRLYAANPRRYGGIGFVFHESDPFYGCDLDDCVDQDGTIAAWAQRIIDTLRTYAERSPSGTGIKLIGVGALPRNMRPARDKTPESIIPAHLAGGIELYDHARFFCITGARLLDTPEDVRPAPEVEQYRTTLDVLVEQIEAAAQAAQRAAQARPAGAALHTHAPDREYLQQWAERTIVRAEERVRLAPDGHRHNTRISMARLVGGLVPLGLADPDELARRLYDAQPPARGSEHQERKTIAWGIDHGAAHPLDLPPPPPQPLFDKQGGACCPTHGRRLRAGRKSGWYCPEKDGSTATGYCGFWWKGSDYIAPEVEQGQPYSPEDDAAQQGDPNAGRAVMLDAPRFTIKTEADLMTLPPLCYLDRGLGIIAGGYHLIYGASGSGKTFFAVERVMQQVAAGRRVLYVPTEDVQGLRYRVAAWRAAHPEAGGNLTILGMDGGTLDLQNGRDVAALLDLITPYQYDLIVIDTLREAHTGDENSSQDTAAINRAVQRLIRAGAAVDVVHHSGTSNERPRGSTALWGNADVVIRVEKDGDDQIRVEFEKQRNAPARDPLAFGLVQQDSGQIDADGQRVISAVLRPAAMMTSRLDPGARLPGNARKVLEVLGLAIYRDHGAKRADLKSDVPSGINLSRELSRLKSAGYITQAANKGDPYYITPAGLAVLGPEYTTAPEVAPADDDAPSPVDYDPGPPPEDDGGYTYDQPAPVTPSSRASSPRRSSAPDVERPAQQGQPQRKATRRPTGTPDYIPAPHRTEYDGGDLFPDHAAPPSAPPSAPPAPDQPRPSAARLIQSLYEKRQQEIAQAQAGAQPPTADDGEGDTF